MKNVSKRCLLFSIFMLFFGFYGPVSNVQAVPTEWTGGISVHITAPENSPPNTSQVELTWLPVSPINGGTMSYEIEKSTDGGLDPLQNPLTTTMTTRTTNTSWVDSGVPNYTNVIYRIRRIETVDSVEDVSTYSRQVYVYPPNENVHDNYMDNTNLCSSCHSTHQGKDDLLMNDPSTTALCLTCHEGLTNSKYDVMNGYTKTATGLASSLGGTFAHNGVEGDVWEGALTTSAHLFDEKTEGSAPGGYNSIQSMGCTTCHGGHATGNYRMLRKSINVQTGAETFTTYDNINVQAGSQATDPSSGESPVYRSGINTFCMTCHGDYMVGTGSGGSGTAPPNEQFGTPGTYRHPVGVSLVDTAKGLNLTTTLPLEGEKRDNTDTITCLTCHYSHGSVAKDLNLSTVVAGDGSSLKSQVSSSLKRLDGMEVCIDCHQMEGAP
jgi:predicted CXXCH cytochrome family protein